MRTWISALCKSKWISLGVISDYMLIEQTKDLEQVRFIDLEFSLFWMRQGFDFFLSWNWRSWRSAVLRFEIRGIWSLDQLILLFLDEGMNSWKMKFIYVLKIIYFLKSVNLEDETGSF